MNPNTFKISTFSTALFSTWIFVEELGLLFDAGDGVSAGLLQKARKVKHVFISHADRDHLGGLLQFNQLNARPGHPHIFYPEDSGSFPALEAFSTRFDPHVAGSQWQGIRSGQEIPIRSQVWVKALRNEHVPVGPDLAKSLSFLVLQKKWKLKPEFLHLPGLEIKALIEQRGRAAISEEVVKPWLAYSGDSPVEEDGRWDGVEVLIHEATFVRAEDQAQARGNRHSSLEEVMRMVAGIKVGRVVLSHFSSRYSAAEIDESILKYCREYRISCPVHRVLPGQLHRNILQEEPINQ